MSEATPRPHFDLPVSRSAAESLARLSTGEETDIRELAVAAQELPDFQSLILHAANASTHGLQHPISSPKHAMAMLGTSRLKDLVDELLVQNKTLRATTDRIVQSQRKDDAK